jgi:hypothetical protein
MGGTKEARAYCEVVNAAVSSAYHPQIKTRQPKILARGDSVCRMEVLLSATPADVASGSSPALDAPARLRRLTDLTAEMYYYLARDLCTSFGMEGEAALRRAIRRFGQERGLRMRQHHLEQGLEISMYNLFTHYDFPSDDRFRRNEIELTDQTRLSETLVCPFHGVWTRHADGNRVGRVYCEEVHHAIFNGYDRAVQTNLSTSLTQGDDRCRFAVYLRPSNKLPPPPWAEDYQKSFK